MKSQHILTFFSVSALPNNELCSQWASHPVMIDGMAMSGIMTIAWAQ